MAHKDWYKQFTEDRIGWGRQSSSFRLEVFATYQRFLSPFNIHRGPNLPLTDECSLLSGFNTSEPDEFSRLLPVLCFIHVGPPFDLEPVRSTEVDVRPFFSFGKTLGFFEEYFDSRVLRRGDRKAGSFRNLDRVISGVTVGDGGGGGVSGGPILFHKRRRSGGRRGRDERVNHSHRCVDSKSALEGVPGIDVGDVRLGDVGTIQEHVHCSG
jgi:hypothetical protein